MSVNNMEIGSGGKHTKAMNLSNAFDRNKDENYMAVHYDRGTHCQSVEGVIAFKIHYYHKVAKGLKCSFLRKFLAFKTAVA